MLTIDLSGKGTNLVIARLILVTDRTVRDIGFTLVDLLQ